MQRREFLTATAGATLYAAGCSRTGWDGYDSSIVIDALGFIGDQRGDTAVELSPAALEHIRTSGVTAINTTLGTVGNGPNLLQTTLNDLDRWDQRLERYADTLSPILTGADIDRAKRESTTGIIYGFQDAAMLEGSLDPLNTFHARGVRVIQLTYNRRNELGDGSLEPDNNGLTDFGRSVVERMNELHMLVDLSHCGHQTTTDGIAHSSTPVAITHSGCLALTDLPRNKKDEDMRALADRGGVFGVYFMPFLRIGEQAMATDVIRHLEHAIDVCGEDHVGIGTDGTVSPVPLTEEYRAAIRREIQARRDAGISAPGETDDIVPLIPDLNDQRRLQTLGELLAGRGHSAARIDKILGGNFHRLMTEVWAG